MRELPVGLHLTSQLRIGGGRCRPEIRFSTSGGVTFMERASPVEGESWNCCRPPRRQRTARVRDQLPEKKIADSRALALDGTTGRPTLLAPLPRDLGN